MSSLHPLPVDVDDALRDLRQELPRPRFVVAEPKPTPPSPISTPSDLTSCQGPRQGPRLRAGRCSNALSSTAQEDNDGPSNIPLGEMDVGLCNRSLEAGIAQRVRDRAAILADFPSEPTAGAGGDRPAAGRDLLNPRRRVQRPERPSVLQFSQSGCGFTVLLYVAGFSDSAPRDSSP